MNVEINILWASYDIYISCYFFQSIHILLFFSIQWTRFGDVLGIFIIKKIESAAHYQYMFYS
jgi:hypothetical protein